MSQKSYDGTPTVYLIPTPIGNLEDITLRSIETLKKVEVIFSEDTRVTKMLLNHLNISKKLISSHKFNEDKQKNLIISYLEKGLDIGIVTDRGTPIISDPGYALVKEAIEKHYNVVGLPGPTALIPALIVSGISPQPFTFYGFLNNKSSKRKKELESLKKYETTLIFYEAPHRLKETLNDMLDVLDNRNISISREISKKYEEVYRGNIKEIIDSLDEVKGELVIIVEGNKNTNDYSNLTIIEHVNLYIKEGYEAKEAIKKVAIDRNITKKEVYNIYHNIGGTNETNSGSR